MTSTRFLSVYLFGLFLLLIAVVYAADEGGDSFSPLDIPRRLCVEASKLLTKRAESCTDEFYCASMKEMAAKYPLGSESQCSQEFFREHLRKLASCLGQMDRECFKQVQKEVSDKLAAAEATKSR